MTPLKDWKFHERSEGRKKPFAVWELHENDYLKRAYDELVCIVKNIGSTEGDRGICGKPATFLPLDDNIVCCSSCHSQFAVSEIKGYNYCPKCAEKIL